MEIEKKFLLKNLPAMLEKYTAEKIEQGYLSVDPVVRVRRHNDEYYLTYKGGGMMARIEHNLPLTKEAYEHLIAKADGYVISKTRYLIGIEELSVWDTEHEPVRYSHSDVGGGKVIELDVFHGDMDGLILAEIEFDDETQANGFELPECFSEDVTFDGRYHNSYLSRNGYKSR